MDRATSIDITKRLIAHVTADTTDLADAPRVEPAECFLDRERWERERDQFFLDTPQVIGFAGQISEPGSFMTAEVMGVPVLITRDKEGMLRAFLNVCAHRGARIASGCGKKSRLTCRFHGWTYGLDGTLAGRGRQSAFEPDLATTSLQQLPVSDRTGLIVVGLRPEMGQLRVEHFLVDIAPALEGLDLAEMAFVASDRFEVAANWKLVVNLSHEGYHFATLHRDSLASMMTGHGVVDVFGLHTRWAFPLRGIESLREKDEADWPNFPPAAVNHTIFPGTVIVANDGNAQMIRVEPSDKPGSSVVYFSSVVSTDSSSDAEGGVSDAARATYEFGRSIFEREDLPISVECQQGIDAGKRPIVVGRNEPVVQLWHQHWEDELS
jgi:phenylpropionate dioxygenase-like ring-hydroxylating dioxygenase large terminal subunit